jgi:hypothetical protein
MILYCETQRYTLQHWNKRSFYYGRLHGRQIGRTAPDASYYLFITEDVRSENPVEESLWVEAAEKKQGWILSIHPWDILNSTILLTIILIVIWMELQLLYPEELKSLLVEG